MKLRLETDRLIIRNLGPGDEDAVYAYAGDPEVAKYMIYPQYKSVEDGIEWLKSKKEAEKDENDWDFGFTLKETGELIGGGGLFYHPEEDIWRIGYNLRKDQWGKGLVVEALTALIAEIQKTRTIRVMEGEFAVENNKSKRVMEKLGMTFYKDSQYRKLDGSATFQSQIYRKEF